MKAISLFAAIIAGWLMGEAALAQPQSPHFLMRSEAFSAASAFDSSEHYTLFSSVAAWSVADTHISLNYVVISGFLTPSYGTATGAFLVVNPSSLDYGEVHVDSVGSRTITLNDTGYWDLQITGMQLQAGTVFHLVPPPELQDTVYALSSRDYTIHFEPTAAGFFRDTLTITHDAGEAVRVTIEGVGTAPGIVVEPDTILFGDLWIGAAASDTFTISNSGTADLHVDSITSTNPVFPPVMIPFIVPRGGSQVLPYTVIVPETLSYAGLLTVHGNAGEPTVFLSAHGVWTELRANPASINLGDVAIADTVDTTITLESAGNTFVLIDSVHLTTDSFIVYQSPSDSLPAYGRTSLGIRFIGRAFGMCSDTLVIENSAGDPVLIPLTAGVTSVDELTMLIPKDFCLNQNFPNPFNPTTTVQFGLPKAAQVRLEIFDILGRRVVTLTDDRFQPGWHTITWNCTSCPSGMYILRMKTDEKTLLRKMLLMK